MTRFQPFNDLPASQVEALKRDVEVRGIVNPILVDEDDKTIDGHQRRRVAAELGIDCPRIVLSGLSDDEKMSLAIALNTFRRHLTSAERSQALQKMAQLGMSTRRMAAVAGVSQTQVRRDLTQVSRNGSPEDTSSVDPLPAEVRIVDPETGEVLNSEPPPRVEGIDGKSYPATKSKPEPSAAEKLAAEVAASDKGYRAAVSRERSKTRDGLLKLDPERAAEICTADDRRSAIAFCDDVRTWVDAYYAALARANLRSVK